MINKIAVNIHKPIKHRMLYNYQWFLKILSSIPKHIRNAYNMINDYLTSICIHKFIYNIEHKSIIKICIAFILNLVILTKYRFTCIEY